MATSAAKANRNADIVERLEAEIARLRAALAESIEENLYGAYHAGLKNPAKNEWRSGGLSDAEWLCRQAGLPLNVKTDANALFSRIPEIAKQMAARAGDEQKAPSAK